MNRAAPETSQALDSLPVRSICLSEEEAFSHAMNIAEAKRRKAAFKVVQGGSMEGPPHNAQRRACELRPA